MKILMLVATSVATDSRVLKQAKALVSDGHSVHIIGKDIPVDFVPPVGVSVSSATTSSPFSSTHGKKLSPLKRFARWLFLPTHRNKSFLSWQLLVIADAVRREFDVIHAHDFTALSAAVDLAAVKKVPYVYDTHEFWSGRAREYRPTPFQDSREIKQERQWGDGAAAIITVSDGVKNALHELHGWHNVAVVHNSFPLVAHDDVVGLTGLGYFGRIGAHRDLETLAWAAREFPELNVVIAGPRDEGWLTHNRELFSAPNITMAQALSTDEATSTMRQLGVALVSLDAQAMNHQLALPNKLFHAVHAGVPVVAAHLPEIERVVSRYALGELYRPGDAQDLVRAVRAVVARHHEYVGNVAQAAPELSWDHDADVLCNVYRRLAGSL